MTDQERERRADEIFRRIKKLPPDKPVGYSCWRARAIVRSYQSFGIWCNGSDIVDVGCGRAGVCLAIPDACGYIGLDTSQSSVRVAREVFDMFPNVSFHHVDVDTPKYNPVGIASETDVVLPVENGWANCVIARSLFTHFQTIEGVQHYLDEFYRILRPDGRLYVTWFRSPPNLPSTDTRRRVFSEKEIRESLCEFKILHEWGGEGTDRDEQWRMVCKRDGIA